MFLTGLGSLTKNVLELRKLKIVLGLFSGGAWFECWW